MSNQQLVVGIIGLGIGGKIAKLIQDLDPSIAIHIADIDRQKTRDLAKSLPEAVAHHTWQDLVRCSDIDLVIIATPNHLHMPIFIQAMARGKHILIEKPAATTAADIEQMSELARDYPRSVTVDHQVRCSPVVQYIKKLVTSKKLGTILTIRQGAYLNLFSRDDYYGSWYNDRERGGGQLLSIGTHQLDIARYILDKPQVNQGAVWTRSYNDKRFKQQVTADSQFMAQFVTQDGTFLELFNDTYCFGYREVTLEVIGSQGIVMYSDSAGLQESFSNAQPLRPVALENPDKEEWNHWLIPGSLYFALRELIISLRSSNPSSILCTLEEAQDNLAIIERFRKG